jgi:hypothetical protein
MHETRLVLLMKDGPVSIASPATLSPAQYAELHAIVKETLTVEDLIEKVTGLARAWGAPVKVERVGKLKDHIR